MKCTKIRLIVFIFFEPDNCHTVQRIFMYIRRIITHKLKKYTHNLKRNAWHHYY